MAKPNLSGMDVGALMDLRKQIDGILIKQRFEIEKDLGLIASFEGTSGRGKGRGGNPMKGKKVAPKYRSSSGETWAGRGATPRWLKAAIKDGKKLDDFLIEKSGGRKAKRRLARKK